MSTTHCSSFQSYGRDSAQVDRSRLLLDSHSNYLAQPENRRIQTQNQRNGKPLPVHLSVRVAGEIFQPRRLCKACLAPIAKSCIGNRRTLARKSHSHSAFEISAV